MMGWSMVALQPSHHSLVLFKREYASFYSEVSLTIQEVVYSNTAWNSTERNRSEDAFKVRRT